MNKLKVLFAATVGALSIGLFAGTAHAEPTPTANVEEKSTVCHPAYVQCLPMVEDIDCSDPIITGPINVKVPGVDPYELDSDANGIGCENAGSPSASPSPSKSPTKAPATKKPTTKPSQSKTPAATSNGPELPRTGSNTPLLVAGIGSGIIVLGGMLVIFSIRTRKVRVETPDDGR